MELGIKQKTSWILTGKIALGAVCVLVTVLSLSRLGSDEWRTLREWLSTLARRGPLGFAIIAAGVVNLFCNAPHLSRVALRKSGKKVCFRGLRESVMPG